MKKQTKDSKQLLFENMAKLNPDLKLTSKGRLVTKPQRLNEYDNYNYPAGADADPSAPWHDKGEDEYSDWDFDDKYNQVVLHSTGGGWDSIDWEFLVPNEADAEAIIAQVKTNPKDPELIKRVDALVNTYLDTNYSKIEWQYPEPDEPDYDTMRKERF